MSRLIHPRRLAGHRGNLHPQGWWLGWECLVHSESKLQSLKLRAEVRLHILQVCASTIGSSEPGLFLPSHGDWTTPPRRLQVAGHGGTWEVEFCGDRQKCCATTVWNGCHSSCYTCSICARDGKRRRRFKMLYYHLPLLTVLNTDPHLLHHSQHGM